MTLGKCFNQSECQFLSESQDNNNTFRGLLRIQIYSVLLLYCSMNSYVKIFHLTKIMLNPVFLVQLRHQELQDMMPMVTDDDVEKEEN